MKKPIEIHTPLTDEICESLTVGDVVLLTGDVITGRDVAHRRLVDAIVADDTLPVALAGATLFYAAPTPARPGQVIGSIATAGTPPARLSTVKAWT